MPKSKKNKVVHLTQVKKKGKDHKNDLIQQLETYVKQYDFVYLFDFDATKSDRIMSLRLKMKQHDGCIFAGRNSLVSLAMNNIGSKTQTSYKRFLKHITGHRGLLFINVPSDKLIKMLESEKSLQEFRDKLLGYAELKASSDGNNAAGSEEEEEEESEEEEEDTNDEKKIKKKQKVMRYIRFKPIKRAKKQKKSKAKDKQDADGDVVLADANEDDD